MWYLAQVFGFVVRSARLCGVLFGTAVLARNALDWFAPPLDFHTRAQVSTYFGIALLLIAGFGAAWRSGSFVAGTIAGASTAAIGATVTIVGAAGLLALWHDPRTMAAIHGSGGLNEVFTLPLLMVFPGVFLGTIGGIIGVAGRRLLAAGNAAA